MAKSVSDIERPQRLAVLPKRPALRRALAGPRLGATTLARHLGKRRQAISDLLLGRRTSYKLAQEVADFLGRDINDLFYVLDIENPSDRASAA